MGRAIGDAMKRALLLLPTLALVAGGSLLGLGLIGSNRALHPAESSYDWSLSDYPNLVSEQVTLRSRTGVALAGRFFTGSSRATIVLSHGYGGNQDEMLPVASFLHNAGFSVFTYDMRGCGESGGDVTFGVLEQDDLASVVDYLVTRPDVDAQRIGALGFSMGAATTLMAAARDPRVKVVVADSAWANVQHWLRPSLSDSLLHPADRFSLVSLKIVEVRTDIDLDTLSPVDVVGRISPRPLLLIHGLEDTVVPPLDGEQIYAAAGEPKQAWWIPGAAHGDTVRASDPEYAVRIVAFLQQALPL